MNTINTEFVNAETLKYLEHRSTELKRFSNKLESEIVKVTKIFGDNEWCRICSRKDTDDIHQRYKAFYLGSRCWSVIGSDSPLGIRSDHELDDEEQDAFMSNYGRENSVSSTYWDNPDYHEFKAKIELGIGNYTSKESFGSATIPYYDGPLNVDLRLGLRKNNIVLLQQWGIDKEEQEKFSSVGADIIKTLVKSQGLQKFLMEIKTELDKMTEEYKQVSEIAENMFKAATNVD